MPSIEELLNEAELHMASEPVNDLLEIDAETREISIPESEIILGVETDERAERKYFHCQKIVGNNIDLSELQLYVVFQNASNLEEGRDRYHVTDVESTEDGYITFSWELSAKVTAYMGDVQFGVCAIRVGSDGVKQNVWNTTIATGKCLIGLSADMSESEQQNASDLYTQLILELNNKKTEILNDIDAKKAESILSIQNETVVQIGNIDSAGKKVLDSIPETFTDLINEVDKKANGKGITFSINGNGNLEITYDDGK